MTDNVTFDRPKLERLRAAIAAAKTRDSELMVFDNREYVVRYAEYLAQYLEKRFDG